MTAMKRLYLLILHLIPVAMITPGMSYSQGWSGVGGGLNGTVHTLYVYDNTLYAGGEFSGNLARLNGTEWEVISNGPNGIVYSLGSYNGKLYVSGDFSSVGGTTSEYVAVWNGSQWEALDWGLDWWITQTKVFNGELFFVGGFHKAGGNNVTGIARFDGTTVKTAGDEFFYGPIYCLDAFDGYLWAGGNFPQVGSEEALRLAYWDGASWTVPDGGAYGPVYVITGREFASELYFGGSFEAFYGISANNIAGFSAGTEEWFPLGSGLLGDPADAYVADIIWENGKMYVGGNFSVAGGNASSAFAVYNEAEGWENTASDLTGEIYDIVNYDNYLYAGGSFDSPVQNIGKWSEPTGIYEPVTVSTIAIRPNPASNEVIIELAGFGVNEKLEALLISDDGKTAGRYKNLGRPEFKLDVSHLSPGMYVVKVCNEKGEFTSGRLMISR
jgi:hypothetical protein